MKLVMLIKMCLNFTYCRIRLGKHLFDTFLVKNVLKQKDVSSPLLYNMQLGWFR